jgi:hypothetical protein
MAAKYTAPDLWSLLDRIPMSHWPQFIFLLEKICSEKLGWEFLNLSAFFRINAITKKITAIFEQLIKN